MAVEALSQPPWVPACAGNSGEEWPHYLNPPTPAQAGVQGPEEPRSLGQISVHRPQLTLVSAGITFVIPESAKALIRDPECLGPGSSLRCGRDDNVFYSF